jgi:hypothetical protein
VRVAGAQICIVVDGSGPMGAVFPTLVSTYVKPLIEYTRTAACLQFTSTTLTPLHAATTGRSHWPCASNRSGYVRTGLVRTPSCRCRHALRTRPPRQMVCHYGLMVYGDLRPFSPVVVDRHLFTTDPARLLRALERLPLAGGNPTRNCATEGVAAAVDVRRSAARSP